MKCKNCVFYSGLSSQTDKIGYCKLIDMFIVANKLFEKNPFHYAFKSVKSRDSICVLNYYLKLESINKGD